MQLVVMMVWLGITVQGRFSMSLDVVAELPRGLCLASVVQYRHCAVAVLHAQVSYCKYVAVVLLLPICSCHLLEAVMVGFVVVVLQHICCKL